MTWINDADVPWVLKPTRQASRSKYLNILTHFPLMPHICVSKLSQHCWNTVVWTLRYKLQWYFNRNSCFIIHGKAFENVTETAAILSRERGVMRLRGNEAREKVLLRNSSSMSTFQLHCDKHNWMLFMANIICVNANWASVSYYLIYIYIYIGMCKYTLSWSPTELSYYFHFA